MKIGKYRNEIHMDINNDEFIVYIPLSNVDNVIILDKHEASVTFKWPDAKRWARKVMLRYIEQTKRKDYESYMTRPCLYGYWTASDDVIQYLTKRGYELKHYDKGYETLHIWSSDMSVIDYRRGDPLTPGYAELSKNPKGSQAVELLERFEPITGHFKWPYWSAKVGNKFGFCVEHDGQPDLYSFREAFEYVTQMYI